MNKAGLALSQTRSAEATLADAWRRVSERQSAEHEWAYNGRRFHDECLGHIHALAEVAPRYGADVDDEEEDRQYFQGIAGRLRERVSEVVARRPASGLLLLRDQRTMFTLGYAASFHWIVLGQVAQAIRDQQLLTLVDRCHQDVLTQVKWVKSEIKASAPQVLCT